MTLEEAQQASEPLVWTQEQVAKALQVTPRTVRELTRTGQLRATYVGRLPRYYPQDVKSYLAQRRQSVA